MGETKGGTTLVEVALDTASDPGSIPGASTTVLIQRRWCGRHPEGRLDVDAARDPNVLDQGVEQRLLHRFWRVRSQEHRQVAAET